MRLNENKLTALARKEAEALQQIEQQVTLIHQLFFFWFRKEGLYPYSLLKTFEKWDISPNPNSK
jgi:hypothetical protein